MTPERWDKVAAIFHAARERRVQDREAYLSDACPDDPRLRYEVERLLRADEEADTLLSARLPLRAALGSRSGSGIGQIILHYELLEKIGEGGMGEVYRAYDKRLDRNVALKFLFSAIERDEDRTRRFMEEARAASSLDHPNICTIHGVEQSPDGELFIVMPYYQGETIKEKLCRGPVLPEETLELAIQVGRGLLKAHSAGIVHRDIKPANLMVTRDGLVKILDFGIAKLIGTEWPSQAGVTIGTIDYMSPEQALGQPVDHRTDIWALGVVLYEMLTGHTPFDAPDLSSLLSSIFQKAPQHFLKSGTELSRDWEAVLRRTLAADLIQRYQITKDLVRDLEALRWQQEARAAGDLNMSLTPSVAVVPFTSISSDAENEYFSVGLTDELIHVLAGVAGLRVVSRTTMLQFKGQVVDIRELSRDLHVSAVLEGSVRAFRNKVRVTVQLVKAVDGVQLWSGEYDRQLNDIFAVQNEIAQNVVRALVARFKEGQNKPVVKNVTWNPRAYRRYLKGRYHCNHWTPESLLRAIEYFRKALQRDPEYAQAQAGLAEAHLLRGFWGLTPPREAWMNVQKAAQAALLIDPGMAEAHACLAAVWAVSEWNWTETRCEFKKAIDLNGGDPLSRSWFNGFYLIPHGLLEEALQNDKRHIDLDPLSPAANSSLAWTYYLLRQHTAALQQARTALELSPLIIEPYWTLALSELALNLKDEAVENLEKARGLAPENTFTLALLVKSYVAVSRQKDALRLCDDLEALSASRYVASTHMAAAHLALNQTERAFEWLDQACEQREVMLLYLNVLPVFDAIRWDPRFGELVRRIGLPVTPTE